MTDLTGKRIAFLLTDGFEDSELTSPWDAVTSAGAEAVLVSPADGSVTGEKGHEQKIDLPVGSATADDFDALVLPGGVQNADDIRIVKDAVHFARAFFDQHKPVAVICHGGWILTEADVLTAGRSPATRRCRRISATPAPRGSTRRSTSTRASCPAATPATCPRSTRS